MRTFLERDLGMMGFGMAPAAMAGIQVHPKIGASWEGFAVEETLRALQPDAAVDPRSRGTTVWAGARGFRDSPERPRERVIVPRYKQER